MADIDAKVWLESVMLDEDDMASDSDTDVCTQQSIKAYVDDTFAGLGGTYATISYADGQDAATLSSAQSYADAGDGSTLSAANSYTDGAVFTHPRDHASSLLTHHDIIINSTLGLQLQTDQWDIALAELTRTGQGALTEPDYVKFTDNGGGSQGLYTDAFDDGTEEEIIGKIYFPNKRKDGTDIYPLFFWTVPTTGTGDQRVCWGLEYLWPSTGGSVGASTVIYSNVSIPAGNPLVADQIYVTVLPTITPPSNELPAVFIRVFRDATGSYATDDYPNDALLGGVSFRYHVNRLAAPFSEF